MRLCRASVVPTVICRPALRRIALATSLAFVGGWSGSAAGAELQLDRDFPLNRISWFDGGFGTTRPNLTISPAPRDVPTVTLTPHAGSLSISLNFGSGLTASQKNIFTTAKTTWEGLLGDYRSEVLNAGARPVPAITAFGELIDGPGNVLGSAGPTFGISQGGFVLTTQGNMRFDTADLAVMEGNGTLYSVILHEMGHVLGFGTLWTYNGLYTDGTGQFHGSTALSTYRTEFNQPGATFVPVELGGGSGTANGHWNESDGGGSLTGITTGAGNDMAFELMTGWLNAPTFISATTIASFHDIGFAAIPEPAEVGLAFAGLAGLTLWVRRRGQKHSSLPA